MCIFAMKCESRFYLSVSDDLWDLLQLTSYLPGWGVRWPVTLPHPSSDARQFSLPSKV